MLMVSRRKGEINGRIDEHPHIVELEVLDSGFRATSDLILAFHQEHGFDFRRGRGHHDEDRSFVRFCFDAAA
jgi:hypothetical protein